MQISVYLGIVSRYNLSFLYISSPGTIWNMIYNLETLQTLHLLLLFTICLVRICFVIGLALGLIALPVSWVIGQVMPY